MAVVERPGERSSRARIIGIASEIVSVLEGVDEPEEFFAALGMASALFIHNYHYRHREDAMKALLNNVDAVLSSLDSRHGGDPGSILSLS